MNLRSFIRVMLFVPLLASAPGIWGGEDDVLPGLENTPDIAAEVNGRKITRNELLRELAGANGMEAIARLVQRILVEQGARQKGISVTAQDIEQQFAVDKRALSSDLLRTPWEKTAPEEIIRAHYGMTIDEYKQLVIRQRLLTRRSVGEGTNPTDDQLLQFFTQENHFFQPPVSYHAQHILISPFDPRDLARSYSMLRPEARQDAGNLARRRNLNRQRDNNLTYRDEAIDLDPVWKRFYELANRVLREVTTGQITFENAVKKYSQDPADQPIENKLVDNLKRSERERAGQPPGDVGWYNQRGPMVEPFFNGTRNMKAGEIKGPIRTPYGLHIVKMLEVRTPPPVTYESCKEAVYNAYMDRQIKTKSEKWLEELEEGAVIRIDRAKMWPPVRRNVVVLPDAGAPVVKAEERDPVVASVNGVEIKRSELWRELLRADGEEALKRLINMEIVLTMLKRMGLERLDWECADPKRRDPQPPVLSPISIPVEAIDLDLNDDRLRHDVEAPSTDFRDYIFTRYGQSIDEYKRKLEATLVLMEAIRRKVKTDDATLRVQFALAKENYVEPAWYEISHILIVPTGGMNNPDKNAHLQAKLIADTVYQNYQQAPTAANFTQLARDYSMDDRPQIKRSNGKLPSLFPDLRDSDLPEAPQLYREIRKQKLEKGMASTPIRTFRGYHIVRIDGYHAEMPPIYENTKRKIERDYLNERAKFYTDIWLRSLNTRAQVKKFMYVRTDELKVNNGPVDHFPIPTE